VRRFSWDPDGTERRAGLYVEILDALRVETFVIRRRLADPRNDDRRGLLATRLDATDARAADVFARLIQARGQQQHRITP
jgi:hypothetical protein